ncbi:(E)-beta-farnesene synthase [Dichanthelium oligosanthes]|uniref:(E)-beta-farnesene synthase n=1 Tax=Dichanthelium oligosanthes TaxID=888268 RepID=A0A1E5VPI6_9POAL|nr:(E)-beta-farnesene synthase [Dichanthelium oligosanthes]
MKEKAQAKKEEVRRIVLDAATFDLERKLDIVDALQRLGVDYHYQEEIDELLRAVYNDKDGGSDDLYVTSLRFYLLRKHGYAVVSDVFEKFRDEQGNISSDDVNILITLYDAAHMRTRGEDVLDNIVTFIKSRLQSLLKTNLEPGLVEEVRVTLETTRIRRVQRVEARRFISVYEKNVARDNTILEFAKLDYNIVQVVYCKESKDLSIWWKDLRSQVDLSFSRDRLVEMYFWMTGIVFEPFYSYSRIMLTKLVLYMALLDDIYDNYSSTEESNIFTTALERWDEKAAEHIPAYLRAFYKSVLRTADDVVVELKKQNNMHAELASEMVLHIAKCYHAEVKWRDERYVPADVNEHLKLSMESIAGMQTLVLTFISLGDVTTREAIEWVLTYPKIVKGITVMARVLNDIMSHEYGVTVEEAIEKLKGIVDEAWMDVVQDCLDQKYPMELLKKGISTGQSIDFIYKREDLFTLPYNLKGTLTSLYAEFV